MELQLQFAASPKIFCLLDETLYIMSVTESERENVCAF